MLEGCMTAGRKWEKLEYLEHWNMENKGLKLIGHSLLLLGLLVFLWQCNSPEGEKSNTPMQGSEVGELVVDTIIYPVTIINPDSLDTWADKRLKNLNHSSLISPLFEALYNGTISAYDYYNHEQISVEEIKEMEASGEIKRDQIAQLQFEESWYFNEKDGTLSKKVHGVLLATPVFNDLEEIKGYKAAFVIKLNP